MGSDEVASILQAGWNRSKTSSIIVVAEGDEEGNAQEVAEKIKTLLPDQFDIRVSTLGHIQRGGSPTARDRILASRLGLAAVDGLLAGQKNVMAGIINDQIVFTSFEDTFQKDKPISQEMIEMVKILSI
jgi:6-phosphofructokinase 1